MRNATFDPIDVDFDRAIDATTLTTLATADVSHVGPAGASAVTFTGVTALDVNTFPIAFNPLTTRGTYGLMLGPNIADLARKSISWANPSGEPAGVSRRVFRPSSAYCAQTMQKTGRLTPRRGGLAWLAAATSAAQGVRVHPQSR